MRVCLTKRPRTRDEMGPKKPVEKRARMTAKPAPATAA